jgi:alkanesulfonate monooxygenase SsuD/methylene tetrahydromethanopterin reductase-like flavin-dependent oxidoreductase (luciferase family)
MKFSVWPNMGHPVDEALDTARWADSAGWYGVWYADHYMPNTGTAEIQPGPAHECWAMLPAIAAVTEHVLVGPLVAPTSIHHPALLANRATTIDHLSNGRMVLGLGAGWQINEHLAYGIELEPPGRRVQRFEEAIQIVRALTTQDRTTFAGEMYTITDATADPKPVQSPLPILVGTAGPRMLRIVARYADEWNMWGLADTIAERGKVLDAHCERIGRDPSEIERSAQALFLVTDDGARAEEFRSSTARPAVAGLADDIAEAVAEWQEVGLDEVIVPDFALGRGSQRLDRMDAIVEHVIPAVRS